VIDLFNVIVFGWRISG